MPPIHNNNDTSEPNYDVAFFRDLTQKLQQSLQASFNSLLDKNDFHSLMDSCTAVQQANAVRLQAVAAASKDASLQHLVQAAEQSQAAALQTFQTIAASDLLPRLTDTLLDDCYDDTDLIRYTLLQAATPEDWAAWAQADAQLVPEVIWNTTMARTLVAAGGARSGQYGPAWRVYRTLHTNNTDSPVLQRLALACALELGAGPPYPLFNQQGHVDAERRFVHYQQSYLAGELDAQFARCTVGELRMVINSDATEEELGWGRQCLWTYRPDLALLSPSGCQWQYCDIVKTDVAYKSPEWYKEPRSYDQILSGGGKCGPRAWYGRFICKAFGIPTWGCQQPGHAAMTRWCRDGVWEVCLGGGWWKSWWEDRGGDDFLLETKARRAAGTVDEYMRQVQRLEWVATAVFGESTHVVRRNGLPDGTAPWYSLAMAQRMLLVDGYDAGSCAAVDGTPMEEFSSSIDGRVYMLHRWKLDKMQTPCTMKSIEQHPHSTESGRVGETTILPASSCCDPTRSSKKILFLPCASGGVQLYVKEDGAVRFDVPSDVVVAGRYDLTLLVATAHRNEEALTVCVVRKDNDEKNDDTSYTLNMPYTTGLWGETESVQVDLTGADQQLCICRSLQPFGFSFREIRLSKVEKEDIYSAV